MNICFVAREFIDSRRRGGIATYNYEMARELVRLNHTVYIIKASESWFTKEEYVFEGINIIGVPFVDFYVHKSSEKLTKLITKILSYFFYNIYRKRVAIEFAKINSEKSLDVLEYPEYGAEVKYIDFQYLSCKTICRFHGLSSLQRDVIRIVMSTERHWDEIKVAERADAITWCSSSMGEIVKASVVGSRLKGIPECVIHNGIRTSFVSDLNRSVQAGCVFYAGTITEAKGCLTLIKACELLILNGKNIKLQMAGKVTQRFMTKVSKNVTLTDNSWLEFIGELNRVDLKNYYSTSTVNVFPSFYEPFGFTALEAMSFGGIVVGSANGGMSEFIKDKKNGYLLSEITVKGIFDGISTVLELGEGYSMEMRLKAIEASKDFSVSRMASKSLKIYAKN